MYLEDTKVKKVFALLALMLFATPVYAELDDSDYAVNRTYAKVEVEDLPAPIPVLSEDMLTRYEAVDLLRSGSAVMKRWSQKFCSTWKVADKTFVTAKHCASGINSNITVRQLGDTWDSSTVRSVTIPIGSDKEGNKDQDWITYTIHDTMKDMVALPRGCGHELKIGEPIAIGHYPAGLNFSVSFGSVITLDTDLGRRSNAVIAIDGAAAPGSSGAAVISMETGKVIGIIIEGIVSRFGAFAIGLESVDNFYLCDGLKGEGDEQEAIHDPF